MEPPEIDFKPYNTGQRSALPEGGWEHWLYRFPSGTEVTVARFEGSYGFEEGLYEVMIIDLPDAPVKLNPDKDLLGYVTVEALNDLLHAIKNGDFSNGR